MATTSPMTTSTTRSSGCCKIYRQPGSIIARSDCRMIIFPTLPKVVAHPPVVRFATARRWGGIIRAVQTSCMASHLDEMIQLCSSDKPKPQTPPPEGIRRVSFKNLQDVPLVLSTGSLRATAETFVPRSLKLQDNVGGSRISAVEGQD